jgi:hypothetical protein
MRRQFSRSFQRNPGNDLVIMQRRVPADLMTKHRSRQQQNLAVDIEVRDGVLIQHVVGTLSPAFDIGCDRRIGRAGCARVFFGQIHQGEGTVFAIAVAVGEKIVPSRRAVLGCDVDRGDISGMIGLRDADVAREIFLPVGDVQRARDCWSGSKQHGTHRR